MRFWIFDEDGLLFRKFWTKEDAARFMQSGFTLTIQPKPVRWVPTVEECGEARW